MIIIGTKMKTRGGEKGSRQVSRLPGMSPYFILGYIKENILDKEVNLIG
jgi:hypothetical protein